MQSIVNMTQVDITGNLHLRHFTIKTNIVFLEDGNGDAVFAAASVSSFQQSETTHMFLVCMFNVSIIAGYVIPHMHKGVRKRLACIPSKAINQKELQPSMCVREASSPRNSNPCRTNHHVKTCSPSIHRQHHHHQPLSRPSSSPPSPSRAWCTLCGYPCTDCSPQHWQDCWCWDR